MIFPFYLASGFSTDARAATESPYENDWNGDLDSEKLALHVYLGQNAQQNNAILTSSGGVAEFDIVCDPSWFGQAEPNEVTFNALGPSERVRPSRYTYNVPEDRAPEGTTECRLYDANKTKYIAATLTFDGYANPTLTLTNSDGYSRTVELVGERIIGAVTSGEGFRTTIVVSVGVNRLNSTGYAFDARAFSGYSYAIPLPQGFDATKTHARLLIDSTGSESPQTARNLLSRRTAVYNWGIVRNPGSNVLPRYDRRVKQPANGSVVWRSILDPAFTWLNEANATQEYLDQNTYSTGAFGFYGDEATGHFPALPFACSSLAVTSYRGFVDQEIPFSAQLYNDGLQKNVASGVNQEVVSSGDEYSTTVIDQVRKIDVAVAAMPGSSGDAIKLQIRSTITGTSTTSPTDLYLGLTEQEKQNLFLSPESFGVFPIDSWFSTWKVLATPSDLLVGDGVPIIGSNNYFVKATP